MKYVNNDSIRSTGKAFPRERGYCQEIGYDAMNRPVLLTQPDNSNIRYTYNKASLPETVELQHLGTGNYVPYVTNINYNEKGQRTNIYYGNGSKTRYDYDAKTFRLTRLLTTRNTGQEIMQDLNYVYDPVGNIVEVYDYAPDENGQTTYYYANTAIEPGGKYEYDALYRLINARGRELASLNMPDYGDFANNIPLPGNNAMQNYQEQYSYDALGNMLSLAHYTTGQTPNWTRDYVYETQNNRLKKHDDNQSTDDYTYDVHGNMLTMPHLSGMGWDYADQLHSATNGTFTSYYNYDAQGERSRKVVEKGAIREERYYMNGYEVYRKYVSGVLDFERQSLDILNIKITQPQSDESQQKEKQAPRYEFDYNKKIVLVETKTIENGQGLQSLAATIRYQYDNHLGSACLELDENAQIISYEEYHPFGTTSYRCGRTETEVSQKRYKYVGKERDEETGLYYYGMRYYAAWLCRFVSVDPLQFKYPELTPFQYASNRPITGIDLDGAEFYYLSNGTFLTQGSDKNSKEVRKADDYIKNQDGSYTIKSYTFIHDDIDEFNNMCALVYGESPLNSVGYLNTAHTIVNIKELREYAYDTPGLTESTKKTIGKDLSDILQGAVYAEYGTIEKYKSSFKWTQVKEAEKIKVRSAAISALTRGKSMAGDGGLLDGNWHPSDPTKGAIQWKGSQSPIGKNHPTFKTKKEFEDYYKNIKQFGVTKWDVNDRFFYYNGIGAVYEKATQEWINKYVEKSGGGKAYQTARRRARGAW